MLDEITAMCQNDNIFYTFVCQIFQLLLVETAVKISHALELVPMRAGEHSVAPKNASISIT